LGATHRAVSSIRGLAAALRLLWSLSIMAAAAAMFAIMWAVMEAILWIAGGTGPLHWTLLAVAVFALLVLWYVGQTSRSRLSPSGRDRPMPDSPEDRIAALEAEVAKLRAEMDMLLAEREAFNKGMKELWEETKQKDREALARPLRPSPPLRLWSDLLGEIGELRDEIRAGFAEILRKLESR
jgi:membrane protein implicated in regulation of membrane protease activity